MGNHDPVTFIRSRGGRLNCKSRSSVCLVSAFLGRGELGRFSGLGRGRGALHGFHTVQLEGGLRVSRKISDSETTFISDSLDRGLVGVRVVSQPFFQHYVDQQFLDIRDSEALGRGGIRTIGSWVFSRWR